jgi:hypothetical protein
MNNNHTSKKSSSKSGSSINGAKSSTRHQERKPVDLGVLADEVKKSMLEDALNHGTANHLATYVREEIVKPWLEFRASVAQEVKGPVPTLRQYLVEYEIIPPEVHS